jgi:hypothetical protein
MRERRAIDTYRLSSCVLQAKPRPAGQQVPEPKGMGTGSGQRRKKKWKKKIKKATRAKPSYRYLLVEGSDPDPGRYAPQHHFLYVLH